MTDQRHPLRRSDDCAPPTIIDRVNKIRRQPVQFQYLIGAWAAIVAVACFALYIQVESGGEDDQAQTERLAAIQYTDELREYEACVRRVEVQDSLRTTFLRVAELESVSEEFSVEFKELLDRDLPEIDPATCGDVPVFNPEAQFRLPPVEPVVSIG